MSSASRTVVRTPSFDEQVRGRQTGGTGADDDDVLARKERSNRTGNGVSVGSRPVGRRHTVPWTAHAHGMFRTTSGPTARVSATGSRRHNEIAVLNFGFFGLRSGIAHPPPASTPSAAARPGPHCSLNRYVPSCGVERPKSNSVNRRSMANRSISSTSRTFGHNRLSVRIAEAHGTSSRLPSPISERGGNRRRSRPYAEQPGAFGKRRQDILEQLARLDRRPRSLMLCASTL